MAGKATCPECCGTCVLGTDNFNRDDADDPGNAWLEVGTADYDIDGNELLVASAGTLEFQTDAPADQPVRAYVYFTRGSQERVRIEIGRDPATGNYLFAEVYTSAGCDYLRVGQVVSSTEEFLLDPIGTQVYELPVGPLPIGEPHKLAICWFPATYPELGLVRSRLDVSDGTIYTLQGETDDESFGLRGALDADAAVRFDNWWFGFAKDVDVQRCPDCKRPPTYCVIGSEDSTEDPCKWDSGTFLMPQPEYEYDQMVTATFELGVGETAVLRVNSLRDGSSFHWGSLALTGAGPNFTLTLRIGKDGTTLATESRVLTGATPPLLLTMCVEFFLDSLLACASEMELVQPSDPVVGGWYSGRTHTDQTSWTEFEYTILSEACDHCDCGPGPSLSCYCLDEDGDLRDLELPTFMVLRFEGIADGWCSLCENANRSFLTEYNGGDAYGTNDQETVGQAGDPAICEVLAPIYKKFRPTLIVCGTSGDWGIDPTVWERLMPFPDFPADSPISTTQLFTYLCAQNPQEYWCEIVADFPSLSGAGIPVMWFTSIPFSARHPVDFVDEVLLPAWHKVQASPPEVGLNPICDISVSSAFATAII